MQNHRSVIFTPLVILKSQDAVQDISSVDLTAIDSKSPVSRPEYIAPIISFTAYDQDQGIHHIIGRAVQISVNRTGNHAIQIIHDLLDQEPQPTLADSVRCIAKLIVGITVGLIPSPVM